MSTINSGNGTQHVMRDGATGSGTTQSKPQSLIDHESELYRAVTALRVASANRWAIIDKADADALLRELFARELDEMSAT